MQSSNKLCTLEPQQPITCGILWMDQNNKQKLYNLGKNTSPLYIRANALEYKEVTH